MSLIFHRNLRPGPDAVDLTVVSLEVGSPGPMMKCFTLPEDAQEVKQSWQTGALDVDAGFPFLRKELHLWSSCEWSDLFRNKGRSHEQRALACAMLTNFVGWQQTLKGANSRSKMLAISILILCVVALAAPVAAASAGFVVTDPGTLVLLGTALVGVGVCTRRLLLSRKKGL